jgi:hypothetical protein
MAQTGFTPVRLYRSSTPAAIPTAVNLEQGELAINIADKKLYSKDSTNAVFLLSDAAWGSGGGGVSPLVINNKTSAYTVVAGDLGKLINCTGGTFVLSLTSAATLGAGFVFNVVNTSNVATDVVTIDPAGSETIDATGSLEIRKGDGVQIVSNGTNWLVQNKRYMRGYSENFGDNTARARAQATGALALGQGPTASGIYSLALGFEASASGIGAIAIGGYAGGAAASGTYATSIGMNSAGNSSQSGGLASTALGGSYASGGDCIAAAIGTNISSYGARATAAVALGNTANVSSSNSVALGTSSSATASYAVALGPQAVASAPGAIAISGPWNAGSTTASGNSAIAIGDGCSATQRASIAMGESAFSAIAGKFATASGLFATAGDAQTATYTLRRATVNTTPAVLTTNNAAASTNNQVGLQNNSAHAFIGIVVARQQAGGGTQSAAWKVEGLIRKESSNATTTLVASTVTAISNVPAWTLSLSADTTNGALAINITGAPAINIRWTASIECTEVIYP